MRVTFRLVPKRLDPDGIYRDFHPAYRTQTDINSTDVDDDLTIVSSKDWDPTASTATATTNTTATRFAKPDRYDVQVLEVNTL